MGNRDFERGKSLGREDDPVARSQVRDLPGLAGIDDVGGNVPGLGVHVERHGQENLRADLEGIRRGVLHVQHIRAALSVGHFLDGGGHGQAPGLDGRSIRPGGIGGLQRCGLNEQGIPEFCVSIAMVENGIPVAGGICNPATSELILGSRDTGVTYNGKPAQPSQRRDLHGALVLASRSEVKRGEWKQFESAEFKIRPMGSVAYKLGLVSAGRADLTFTLVPKNEWDVAEHSGTPETWRYRRPSRG